MVEWNRNVSRIYDVGGRKVVSKYYKKPIFFRRELFFYDFSYEVKREVGAVLDYEV